MTPEVPSRTLRSAILTIALLAASLLAYQVLLTRVCALRLHFHFGFLIISNSLLGIGASGSVLALFERQWRLLPDLWVLRFSVAYLLSLPLSWWWLLTARIPESLRFDDWEPTLQFAGFNLACAVPFFFGGLAIGLILTTNARRVHAVYAADLVGAGLGCLLCPLLLWDVGAGGCFLAAVVLGMAGCSATMPSAATLRVVLILLSAGAGLWMSSFDSQFPVPGKRYLDLTQSHTLRDYGRPVYSRWSANSRIDVLPLPTTPGSGFENGFLSARGSRALGLPLPRQWWIAQDGDAGTFLTDFGGEPDKLPVLRQSLYSASFQLKEGINAKVCVIGVGGGPDLWAAKIHDVALIRGIELNEAILEVHRTVAEAFSKPLLDDPRVELVCGEGRNELMRTDERFDVIQLTGIDTWTALNSGAYVLAENYLYTVEACRTMYERLVDGGILQITRMAAGMETLRLLNNMFHALPEERRAGFPGSVAALRTADGLIAVLLKKGAFAEGESAQLRRFLTEAGIDPVFLPDGDPRAHVQAVREQKQALDAEIARLQHEIDRRTAGIDDAEIERLRAEQAKLRPLLVPLGVRHDVGTFVVAEDKQRFVDSYPFDISATTDDRPYFFSFLRWSDPEQAEEFLHQPTWVVQGNPLFLRNQLLFSTLAAALFILLPLLFRGGASSESRYGSLRFLVYFAGLGMGFIGIEVALIQKFTLLLGLPLYSIVVTLCAILVFTGIGSSLSRPLLEADPERGRWVPIAVFLLAMLLAFLSPWIVGACIGLPLAVRAAVVVLLIAPMGIALGMPFAHGIRIVERVNPSFVPWAWAVNGCLTVIGSIATVILSMNFGFGAVMFVCGLIYLVAFAAIDTLARRPPPPREPAEEEPAGQGAPDEADPDSVVLL